MNMTKDVKNQNLKFYCLLPFLQWWCFVKTFEWNLSLSLDNHLTKPNHSRQKCFTLNMYWKEFYIPGASLQPNVPLIVTLHVHKTRDVSETSPTYITDGFTNTPFTDKQNLFIAYFVHHIFMCSMCEFCPDTCLFCCHF